MPMQTQKDYWTNQWSERLLDRQIVSGPKKAWWPILVDLLRSFANGDLIVEAGCGMGQYVYLVNQMGKRIIGVDVTEQALSNAKSVHPQLRLSLQDVRHLALADQTVELMISLGVVEHFEQGPDEVLAEAARVVRPGGRLFITVPFSNWYRRFREPIRRAKHRIFDQKDQTFYQYTFSQRWFCEKLSQHGFQTEKTFLHHSNVALKKDLPWLAWFPNPSKRKFSKPKIYKLWGRLFDRVSPQLMSHMLLVVATRS
jgi:ubiquinone/menaquinone biosynthesis C-methylase UbiE